MAQRRRVLTDHTKRGQKFVPPFTELLGPMREVSWVNTMIPELLWIGLIQYQHGHHRGVELITSMARSARALCPELDRNPYATTSSFSLLSNSASDQLRDAIAERDELSLIQDSLEPLVSWYPECPFRFLFAEPPMVRSENARQQVKAVVSSLYRRSDRDPMMVQATAIWLSFDAGILKVNKGLALAQFPEIDHYPETEISQKVGASIRASLNMFFGPEYHSNDHSWPRYFWNRGLVIEPCEFTDD